MHSRTHQGERPSAALPSPTSAPAHVGASPRSLSVQESPATTRHGSSESCLPACPGGTFRAPPSPLDDNKANHEGLSGERQRPPALGLVLSQTTGTPTPQTLTLDPIRTRINRMRKGVRTAAEIHEAAHPTDPHEGTHYPVMITCTYVNGDDWRPEHIKEFLRHPRQYLQRRGHDMPYVWVAEMQKRGVIHYHVLLWIPNGVMLPKPDKQGWWPHGSTRIEKARSAVGYLVKYASKGAEGHRLPDGARMFGCGGLTREARSSRAYKMAPAWVREMFEESDEPRRAEGGGWVSRISGDWLPSPWEVRFIGGNIQLTARV